MEAIATRNKDAIVTRSAHAIVMLQLLQNHRLFPANVTSLFTSRTRVVPSHCFRKGTCHSGLKILRPQVCLILRGRVLSQTSSPPVDLPVPNPGTSSEATLGIFHQLGKLIGGHRLGGHQILVEETNGDEHERRFSGCETRGCRNPALRW